MRYACAVCRRIITDMRATILPDGRLEVRLHCHGDVFAIRQDLDLRGIAFHAGDILDLDTRDPDEYVGTAGSGEGPAQSPER